MLWNYKEGTRAIWINPKNLSQKSSSFWKHLLPTGKAFLCYYLFDFILDVEGDLLRRCGTRDALQFIHKGKSKKTLGFRKEVSEDSAVFAESR